MVEPNQIPTNPLSKYFRQPAIYIKLPSQGQYWPDDALNLPVTGQIPVYPMTTKDEIILKTPDALMTGTGVVEVIQSCVPSIVDAWKMPSIDVDSILIAIRIATFGHNMDFDTNCPHCNAENTHSKDLRESLAEVTPGDYSRPMYCNDLVIKLRPQPYFTANKAAMIQYEEQKILAALENVEQEVEVRAAAVAASMQRLVDLGLTALASSTEWIQTDDGQRVLDQDFIKEFYSNAENSLVRSLQEKLAEIGEVNKLKPVKVMCIECQKDYNVPVEFDYANFFGKGF